MDKALTNQLAQTTALVSVTPDLLREAANRLEQASKAALPGECVQVPFTRRITLYFNPDTPTFKVLPGLEASDDLNTDHHNPAPAKYERERTAAL